MAFQLPVGLQQASVILRGMVTHPLQQAGGSLVKGHLADGFFMGGMDETDDAQAVEPVKEVFAKGRQAVAVVVDAVELSVKIHRTKEIPEHGIQAFQQAILLLVRSLVKAVGLLHEMLQGLKNGRIVGQVGLIGIFRPFDHLRTGAEQHPVRRTW